MHLFDLSSHTTRIMTFYHIPISHYQKKVIKKLGGRKKNWRDLKNLGASSIHHLTVLNRSEKLLSYGVVWNPKTTGTLFWTGLGLALIGPASTADLPLLGSIQLSEPSDSRFLPTWVVRVSNVGQTHTRPESDYRSWKGFPRVPLLGGAFCACTWHFFYNSESLEIRRLNVNIWLAITSSGNTFHVGFQFC
ncbi:hypothetical protein UlMin_041531 [Ulmus minor]